MSAEAAILRLSARVTADYLSGGQVTYYAPDLNDVATLAQYTASAASSGAASAAAASSSYALMAALGASAYGIGTLPLHLPRAGSLGSMAFLDAQEARGIFTSTQNAAYQMTPHDFGKLLLTTTGTNTWTAPLAADLPDGWHCLLRNRSGNNLTIARSGSDTMNAAATTVTIATAATITRIIKTSSTTFEVA